VQSALYRIAELASAAQDMQEFYGAIHAVVGELMNATNFYIALYDDERQLISWPYRPTNSTRTGPSRTSGSSSVTVSPAGRPATSCGRASPS
jgi:hypothetical protein